LSGRLTGTQPRGVGGVGSGSRGISIAAQIGGAEMENWSDKWAPQGSKRWGLRFSRRNG
jgi:hypothetical protein